MTHTIHKYQLYPFWDEEYKTLDYINEPFNDPTSVNHWVSQGYQAKICGELCDMRHRLPIWSQRFIDIFEGQGWKDFGIAFYRMRTGTVMPVHGDLYRRYVELFNLNGKEHTIRRALILLEDWKSGHYLEVNGAPYVDWKAGSVVEWQYDAPHMAANIGLEDRYTLQITGHVDD
jgi:hypothetical protein